MDDRSPALLKPSISREPLRRQTPRAPRRPHGRCARAWGSMRLEGRADQPRDPVIRRDEHGGRGGGHPELRQRYRHLNRHSPFPVLRSRTARRSSRRSAPGEHDGSRSRSWWLPPCQNRTMQSYPPTTRGSQGRELLIRASSRDASRALRVSSPFALMLNNRDDETSFHTSRRDGRPEQSLAPRYPIDRRGPLIVCFSTSSRRSRLG